MFLNDDSALLAFMLQNLILSVQLKHLCPLFLINNEEFIWVHHNAQRLIWFSVQGWGYAYTMYSQQYDFDRN